MPVLPILGRGVVIDRLTDADAQALAVSHSDPDNARYQGWPSPLAPADARRFIEEMSDAQPLALDSAVQLAIRETTGGPLTGDLYLHRSEATPRTVEIGITLVPGSHGRGLATAAVAATLDAAFSEGRPGGPVDRLVALVDVGNLRSRRLFERLGFRVDGRHTGSARRRDGTLADELVFVMTDQRWHEARRPPPPPGDRPSPS